MTLMSTLILGLYINKQTYNYNNHNKFKGSVFIYIKMYSYCSPYCFIYINSTFVTLALLFKELFLTHFYGFNNGTKV